MSSNKPLPMESVASVPPNMDQQKPGGGLQFFRHFTREDLTPYDEIEWENRTVSITNEKAR